MFAAERITVRRYRSIAAGAGSAYQLSIEIFRRCPRSTANAGSVMSRTDGRGSTQTCLFSIADSLQGTRPRLKLGYSDLLYNLLYNKSATANRSSLIEWEFEHYQLAEAWRGYGAINNSNGSSSCSSSSSSRQVADPRQCLFYSPWGIPFPSLFVASLPSLSSVPIRSRPVIYL